MNATDYANTHRADYVTQLKDLLRIPSIGTLPDHGADVRKAADWVAGQLRQIGLKNVEIHPTAGHPVVYGEWTEAKGAPTVLIYGHYDVQPVDPLNEWQTSPFEPTE